MSDVTNAEVTHDENGIALVCAKCGITNDELAKLPERTTVGSKRSLNRLRICSGCLTVYYCGAKCQKEDWQNHKEECNRIRAEREKNPNENKTTSE